MKKYFQSIAYIIFIAVTLFAIATAIKSYENPFSLYEHPLVWIAAVALIIVIILKEALNIVSQQKAEQLQLEKDGIQPEEVDNWAWAKSIINKWTAAKAIEEEDEIILDHNYDGIKELDNNLPPWWLYLFYATIIFAAVYLTRYHILGADTQEMEYAHSVEEAKRELAAYKSNSKEAIVDAETATVLTDASDLSRGKAVYNLNCAACHVADGGGGIGPNLTDEYWILGGGMKNIFNTIANGGRDGKGMVAWNKTLKPKDIQKVASYIISLQGTTPAKPKEPQGELYKEDGEAPAVVMPTTEEQLKDSIQ
ncbi:cbb3-type cytochrome c oxidase N-terminal domain-containing protein [Tenacibaculum tangerinum]|uniref:Cbb3-type cytochrome c oxidase N-terminal domain-containing protein n=1 Tax=Tenacibaculum tangerinum TaxID=3038772 RepID=A0ABY8L994_9FLAO|nr:cbb3-type cytochrome c oxidase N-terminal domain-containing protein [Tenacibaculum tangerinum]WGH76815.1 cbb3-type cytochrome c oxidase N-terminal domain-containing protein [Tenacibaculum tangerinum]